MSFEKSELPSEPSPRSSSRRSTFSVEKVRKQDKKASLSPGVQDLVNAMDTENSKEEMKQNLIKALDKKVQEKGIHLLLFAHLFDGCITWSTGSCLSTCLTLSSWSILSVEVQVAVC